MCKKCVKITFHSHDSWVSFFLFSQPLSGKVGKVFAVNKECNFQIFLHMCWEPPPKRPRSSSKYRFSVVRCDFRSTETRWKMENWDIFSSTCESAKSFSWEKNSQRGKTFRFRREKSENREKISDLCVVKFFPLSGLEVKISKRIEVKFLFFENFPRRYFK